MSTTKTSDAPAAEVRAFTVTVTETITKTIVIEVDADDWAEYGGNPEGLRDLLAERADDREPHQFAAYDVSDRDVFITPA